VVVFNGHAPLQLPSLLQLSPLFRDVFTQLLLFLKQVDVVVGGQGVECRHLVFRAPNHDHASSSLLEFLLEHVSFLLLSPNHNGYVVLLFNLVPRCQHSNAMEIILCWEWVFKALMSTD
jgi:hypothetical protein